MTTMTQINQKHSGPSLDRKNKKTTHSKVRKEETSLNKKSVNSIGSHRGLDFLGLRSNNDDGSLT
jgi:hypothetical protein